VAHDSSAGERSAAPADTGIYLFNRTGPLDLPLTVAYAMGGTATAGEDYLALSGSVVIPAGRESAAIKVKIRNDRLAEPTETIVLTLSPQAEYEIDTVREQATVSIVDNDPAPQPANDLFGQRIVLTGARATATGTNMGASRERGEPNPTGGTGKRSVWWSWTAPATGDVTISTAASQFDTTLGVYTGDHVRRLTLVAENDDADLAARILTSQVGFRAQAGQTYQIVVNGYRNQAGPISLAIQQQGSGNSAASIATSGPLAAELLAREALFRRWGRGRR
jgi:hypothetical protein